MNSPAHYRFGETEVHVRGNLLCIRAHGPLLLEVAQQLIALLKQMHEEHGRYYLLIDLNQAGGIQSKLRRWIPEQVRAFAPTAGAFYGGNTAVRAMGALVIGAITLITGKRQQVAHFATEVQAMAWLTAVAARANHHVGAV